MASMLQEWNDLFNALFFGSGSWLGVLILLCIFVALMVKWKYSTVVFMPVALFMGMEYLDNGLAWQALTLFFSILFMSVYLIKDVKQ